jgi:Xaa-Pro dipeptidase
MHQEIRGKFSQAFRTLVNNGNRGVVFLWGGDVSSRYDTDTEEEFRQESNFLYLTGIELPDFALAIDMETQVSVLFAPKRDETYAMWNGEVLTLEQIHEIYGNDLVLYTDDIVDTLISLTRNQEKTIYLLPTQSLPEFTNVNKTALKTALGRSRVTKTQSELQLMRISASVSSDAHIALMKDSEVGLYEYNYGGYFEYYTASCSLQHQAYLPIVGSGNRSAILHYNTNRYQTRDGDFILIDAGAEFRGYGTDITRTFPVNGVFSPAQVLVYEMVEDVVEEIEAILRPGIVWSEMNVRSQQLITNALLKAGFLTGPIDELIRNRMWTYFYPHSLGHSVGLDVHDPGLAGLSLQENMVVTVEPGIYFNRVFMNKGLNDPIARRYMVADRINTYLNMNFGGVRIEDIVIITATGIEQLAKAPKSVSEIEAIMRSS